MSYCCFSAKKIKVRGEITARYNHNYRMEDVENADKDMEELNEELIELPTAEGRKLSYNEAIDARLAQLPYYAVEGHKPRKNAVYAIEGYCTFSKDAGINLEDWKRQNVEWLNKTFNVAPDGKSNVLSVVYHADEGGNVHCHALIVPIDPKGRLNASYFLDGSRKLSNLQTDYAKAMEQLGLERGVRGSSAKHANIRKFYGELNKAIEAVREPVAGETAMEYYRDIKEQLETAHAAFLRERKQAESEMTRRLDIARNAQMDAIEREFKTVSNAVEAEIAKLEQAKERIGSEVDEMEIQRTHIVAEVRRERKKLSTIKSEIADVESEIGMKTQFYDNFVKRLEILRERDIESAKELLGILEKMNTYDLDRNDNDLTAEKLEMVKNNNKGDRDDSENDYEDYNAAQDEER